MSSEGRYSVPVGGPEWTADEDDIALEACLPCERQAQLNGACVKVAEQLLRGARKYADGSVNGSLVWRRVYGLAAGLGQYKGPGSQPRANRGESKATSVENMLISHACHSQADVVERPSIEYMARLLNRPFAWVKAELENHDPRRAIKGFF